MPVLRVNLRRRIRMYNPVAMQLQNVYGSMVFERTIPLCCHDCVGPDIHGRLHQLMKNLRLSDATLRKLGWIRRKDGVLIPKK